VYGLAWSRDGKLLATAGGDETRVTRPGEVRLWNAATGEPVLQLTPPDRAAFAEELATAITSLVSKYHDEGAERGRDHRLIVAVHPSLKDDQPETTSPEGEEP
jgi:WD40 repeat protein